MKVFLKSIILFVLGISPFILLVFVFNTITDPYGVVVGNMEKQITEPNQRYLKTKHLIENPLKYDSYFIGSSRVGKIDTRNIIDNNKWYNLSYSEAIPAETLKDLKILINNGVTIKRIIMGLDNISYSVSPEAHASQSLRKPYEPFGILDYLILKPSYDIFKAKYSSKQSVYYDIYGSGFPIVLFQDNWIETHKDEHINDPKFDTSIYTKYYTDRTVKTIEELKEIIKLCKDNKIDLRLFINPMHHRTYLDLDYEAYFSFLEELVLLAPFYDFSGLNKITLNNYNYYETSHYRPNVGNMIIEDVLYNHCKISKLVTAKNIDSVISKKQQDFRNTRMN